MAEASDTKVRESSQLPPRPRGRPRAEDAIALTNHILAVAREEFYELGFGHAGMNSIAQKARISTETLYARFKDKRTLFEAMMQATIDSWAEGAEKNPAPLTTTLRDTLRHYVAVHVRAMLSPDYMDMSILIIAESKRFPELGKMLLDKIPDRNKVIADHIRRYAKKDRVPCKDPDFAAAALRGMVSGLVQSVLQAQEPFGGEEQAALIDKIVDLFMASRKAW